MPFRVILHSMASNSRGVVLIGGREGCLVATGWGVNVPLKALFLVF